MGRGRKPDANQYPLPLSGKPADDDVKKRIDAISYRRTGLKSRRWEDCRRLLKKAASLPDGLYAKHKVIAGWFDWPESRVRKTIDALVWMGVMKVTRHGHNNSHEIVWAKLWSLEVSVDSNGHAAIAQNEQSECSNRTSCLPNLNGQSVQNEHAPLEELTSELTTKETSSSTRDARKRLEEVLLKLGVDRPADAVGRAFDAGCSVAELDAIVAHWHAHGGGKRYAAWGAGALYRRIQNARPELPVDRGWPTPSDAWEKHCADKRAAQQRIERRRELATSLPRFEGSMVEEFKRKRRESDPDV